MFKRDRYRCAMCGTPGKDRQGGTFMKRFTTPVWTWPTWTRITLPTGAILRHCEITELHDFATSNDLSNGIFLDAAAFHRLE